MSKSRARQAIAIVAIGIALFATLGESSKDDDAKKSDPTATTVAASSAAAPLPIGTEALIAKGWNLKVNSAELNADATLAAANQFNTPQPGTQFVLVNVSVTNNSDEPGTVLGEAKISLLPSSGVAIDSYSCLVTAPGEFDSMAQMQPGATATGNICFQVPPADAATSVLLAEPQFTMDKTEDQKFFAIQ